MKINALLILVFVLISCKSRQEDKTPETMEQITDNPGLTEIYKNDQNDRRSDNINWYEVSKRDSLRRVRVYELLDSGKVRTANDYRNAAMVFQHGNDSTAYGMAVKLMKKSIELDSTASKWLLAAATDRYLLSKGAPQIYGTQYRKMGDDPWELSEIDTTKISDAERKKFGVETLAQQRETIRQMNKKKLSGLREEGRAIDEIVTFIKAENSADSDYDISESGINSFGYHLMGEGKNEEALKIFKLNTELYPDAYNTYDSYGECLMVLGQKEKAIEAYKRSLELNPKNTNAEKIINEHK